MNLLPRFFEVVVTQCPQNVHKVLIRRLLAGTNGAFVEVTTAPTSCSGRLSTGQDPKSEDTPLPLPNVRSQKKKLPDERTFGLIRPGCERTSFQIGGVRTDISESCPN